MGQTISDCHVWYSGNFEGLSSQNLSDECLIRSGFVELLAEKHNECERPNSERNGLLTIDYVFSSSHRCPGLGLSAGITSSPHGSDNSAIH